MFGVRLTSRGSGSPLATWLTAIVLIVVALMDPGLLTPRFAQGEEPGSGFRPANSARLPRSIKQTAAPGATPTDEALPEGRVPRRERLTGPDPEVEELKEPLTGVLIEGNRTIESEEILKKIRTRPGRPPDPSQIKDDVRALYSTRWFMTVETRVSNTPKGPVLVFKVVERPMLQKVEYQGNKKIKTKELSELTGLKVGGAYDIGANKESARRIESHYHEKGFVYAKVELKKGDSPEDREVVFDITEGPKVHVAAIKFIGNKEIGSDVLKTQVKTRTRILWLFGGKYDPATIPDDLASLKDYYHNLGYFDVKVKHSADIPPDRSTITLKYEIEEGVRYKVRNVEFVGNRVIPETKLRADIRMQPGKPFNKRFLDADAEKITSQYGELGRIFARVEPVPRYLEEPGIVDLVYNINEDRPYRIGRIHVNIHGDHPHTKESVVLTRLRFRPGELASLDKIKKSEQALRNSMIFAGQVPGSPDGPRITMNQPDLKFDDSRLARGQSTDDEDEGESIFRGQNPGGINVPPGNPSFGEPAFGEEPSIFGDQAPGWIDSTVDVNETQTGKLMFGVGVNSNYGFVGNAVLEENNFDLFRPPTSWSDVFNGTAWRGGGQQLRLEAVPGNQLSRYMLSWRDPKFLEQDVSLGVNAFYFTRFFPNWREQRTGGRVALGQQFTPTLSGLIDLRLENVNISNPSIPTPPQLSEVLGSNFLSTIRGSLAHDTRDSSFIPGKGHLLEVGYEQGFGEFVYPKVTGDARQYFTLRERPDGGNRHILALVGQVGWADSGIPIFEKFYAGGFQSFRGFAFYGVSPQINGVRIGGRWQALGSAEYMLPVTADDSIQLVGFTDFGTVQDSVSLDQFRLTVGGGIRLTIPAMGPMPFAIDFGIPVLQQNFDNRQLVAFYVGVLR
ncbi:MAG: outer membrane protein assembly factor [Planctomycetales bacterium]